MGKGRTVNKEKPPMLATDFRQAQMQRVIAVVPVGDNGRMERVSVARYQDATLFDRMYRVGQISEAQLAAGVALSTLWTEAGLNPAVTADLGPRMPRGEDCVAEDEDALAPIDQYRREMRRLPSHMVRLLEGALSDGRHPGTAWLATFQAALDALKPLADRMGVDVRWAEE